ncbi:PD-(D/E)XK nuclease family protein [Actinoplanes sp. NPDC023714]|uniref:PD-(D/E)XK nuclease family protein n=1 Tax=Actinoplanes sp. NPDC023714 TaxID=3154322 RepID=UPI0034049B47
MTIERWERELDLLTAETARLKAEGRWQTGPHTILQFLKMSENEVKVVACLAWLLAPENRHGLGDLMARRLFDELGVPFDTGAPVRVSTEEPRFTAEGRLTRADLIIRVGNQCVLVEAKINAGQHGDQCARLSELWADEKPRLVFLTRHPAETAPAGWETLTWRRVADLMLPLPERASAAARDLMTTMSALSGATMGDPAMADEKIAFYLRHQTSMAEWAAVRDDAVRSVVAAIEDAVRTLDPIVLSEADHGWYDSLHGSFPTFELSRPGWGRDGVQASIAVQWSRDELLTGANCWPYVGLRVSASGRMERNPLVRRITEKVEPHAMRLGWPESEKAGLWRWWRWLKPEPADDLSSLTVACRSALEEAWRELSAPLDVLFAE